MRSRVLTILAVFVLLWTWAGHPAAHDLPADVAVHLLVKPEGRHLRVLLRVPLEAMRDVDYATRGPEGLLDLTDVERALREAVALWIAPALAFEEDGSRLASPRVVATRVSLPSDRSFASYERALAHVTGPPLNPESRIHWNQSLLDVLLEYDIRSQHARFAVEPAFAKFGVRVVTGVRVMAPDGTIRAFELGGNPGLVRLDPRWYQAAWRFVELGFAHILGGADHLLFLVCLAIPLRRLSALVPVVTAFAVAHSITLIATAFGLAPRGLWFPPLVETLIAGSIVCMAIENVLASSFSHRWLVAFAFGLVHGFGFGFALQESLQFAGTHLVASLLAFNVGVELGQLLVLALLVPLLVLTFRHAATERIATIVLSALVGHVAWHWMTERGAELARFSVAWPHLDATLGAAVAGWIVIGLVSVAALWALRQFAVQS